MSQKASYIIGIDFGTTHSTMAYTSVKGGNEAHPVVTQMAIVQVVESQVIHPSCSLPSFIYFPSKEELKAGTTALPWDAERSYTIGDFARTRGAEIPTRLISSAKSWLCHPGIQQKDKILPFESEENEQKMSPVEACANILLHLREAWNFSMPTALFEEQIILITVPASFEPNARQYVQEAALQAGYPETILLEEPQAAFYAWLHAHADLWRKQLRVGDSILVIDIGGGTTDFTLIAVEEEQGNLVLNRRAVGAHLLLGGDNIDLGLAYKVKQRLEQNNQVIDHWQLQALVHQCRQIKEKFMEDGSPASLDVTVLGRGSRLIGSSLKETLFKEEVLEFIIEGFFPLVSPDDRSPKERRAGIQQIGLPYVQDPRISCQLANFLFMNAQGEQEEQFPLPTAVLFNGGTLKSALLRQRLLDLLNSWAKTVHAPEVKELQGANYDYAVSSGAAYYGLIRENKNIRIRGGTSRSYFIGVEEAMPAVPGMVPPIRAVCVVPFGLEEGEERELKSQQFALALGEQATFRFFSYSTQKLKDGTEPSMGTIIRNWKEELTELHPIETILHKNVDDGKTIAVSLKTKVTELGVLELWFVAKDGRKWKLEFDIR
jgi:molecular chaperone DnaK (HSP70)